MDSHAKKQYKKDSIMQRTVVVGMGHIGHRHARAYTECEQAQLVAVCDRVEELARAAGEKFGAVS